MSTVKKEARLSGLLLARKGVASPSHTDHRLNVQVMDQFASQKQTQPPVFETNFGNDSEGHDSFDAVIEEVKSLSKKQSNVIAGEVSFELDTASAKEVVEKETVIDRSLKVQKRETEVKPVSNSSPAVKRIAMTLRMEDHLKLRLYAAHTRKSCQEIISEALDSYLAQDEKSCGMSNCNCLSS